MVRRIIDFASGLTYALDGTMAKTADGVVLVLPPSDARAERAVAAPRTGVVRAARIGLLTSDDRRLPTALHLLARRPRPGSSSASSMFRATIR